MNNAKEYLNSGNKKVFSGDYQGAIEDFNKAIEVNPIVSFYHSLYLLKVLSV